MNYTLTISEQERQIMAEAFAIMARKIGSCTPVIDAASGTDHAKTLLSPPSTTRPSTGPSGPELPAVASHLTSTMRDRWARNRKGEEEPFPEGCETVEVHLAKTEQKEKFLRVTWQNNGQGYGDANCFDQKLWPWLINSVGQQTRLYLVRRGNYTNIVGVRA